MYVKYGCSIFVKNSKHWLDKYASRSGVSPMTPYLLLTAGVARGAIGKPRRLLKQNAKLYNIVIYWVKCSLPGDDEEVVQRIMDACRENAIVMPNRGIPQENLEKTLLCGNFMILQNGWFFH